MGEAQRAQAEVVAAGVQVGLLLEVEKGSLHGVSQRAMKWPHVAQLVGCAGRLPQELHVSSQGSNQQACVLVGVLPMGLAPLSYCPLPQCSLAHGCPGCPAVLQQLLHVALHVESANSLSHHQAPCLCWPGPGMLQELPDWAQEKALGCCLNWTRATLLAAIDLQKLWCLTQQTGPK